MNTKGRSSFGFLMGIALSLFAGCSAQAVGESDVSSEELSKGKTTVEEKATDDTCSADSATNLSDWTKLGVKTTSTAANKSVTQSSGIGSGNVVQNSDTTGGIGGGGKPNTGNGNGTVANAGCLFRACEKSEAKDPVIAAFVVQSVIDDYPLTRLTVDASGAIVKKTTAPELPPGMVDALETINRYDAARTAVADALSTVSKLTDYKVVSLSLDSVACPRVDAWTPSGVKLVSTYWRLVVPTEANPDSWRKTRKAFARVCPLLKVYGDNEALVDPPSDGSTAEPVGATVSAEGVRADAFRRCPVGTPVGTFCKLSSASGPNYTGERTCQIEFGTLKCSL